ncbi:MAG: 2-succinyl-5-enolpyruvyl-6-hydroxy-3-cyclohexene-1-carboxylic-acid synthase [Bacteroidetes bacterium]|jgi:2-succinyl-5-enolpyruvyl-6-hydroxy-3-cyclohexene-1-carboxylate synthase|nr:2-succinyl-5-enolpyruvyl-6-hydroxy-3-cyclohexene-1-carboxylic-acid synthase [Bacteroidota bacterium]
MSNLSQCLHAFITEFLNFGVKHVVICPGSRNFPIIKTVVAANKFVKIHSAVDERSAGFLTLGLAQQTNSPVVVCCTSGTASLNLYPAIAEAYYSETPIIVLTADRPAESVDNWEGQCIRQNQVFDQHVVASFVSPENLSDELVFKQCALNSIKTSLSEKGPVHINMPFAEPFYSQWDEQKFTLNPIEPEPVETKDVPEDLIDQIKSAKNILWLNGASRNQIAVQYPANLVAWSDVTSNVNQTTTHWESLVSSSDDLNIPKPDLLITTGKYFVSKKLRHYLRSVNNLNHWHLNDGQAIPTPFGTNPISIPCEYQSVANAVGNHYSDTALKTRVSAMNQTLKSHIDKLNWLKLSEMSAIRDLYGLLPSRAILHISNSMPIRYVGLMERREDIFHAANRGTSGIDGCTSTALGAAFATNQNVFLFTGDIAFLYDINALWQSHIPDNLRIVVFNNSGGGIFELIDGPNQHPESLVFQTTTHNRSISELADHFGLNYLIANESSDTDEVYNQFIQSNKPTILEVKTDRHANNRFYKSYTNAVIESLNNDRE